MTHLLIVGQGRSGTTWVGRVLGLTAGGRYVHEPDDERRDPQALRAHLVQRSTPVIAPTDPLEAHPSYRRLWEGVFEGGLPGTDVRSRLARRVLRSVPPSDIDALERTRIEPTLRIRAVAALARPRGGPPAEVVVAKSVRALGSVEWIAEHFRPRVLIVTRHPLDVLASRLELGWGIAPHALHPPADGDSRGELHQMASQIGTLGHNLAEAASRHPDWEVVRHGDLCDAPVDSFRELGARLGLEWSDAQEQFLEEANQTGTGWSVQRVASEQRDRWKQRLTADQVKQASEVLEQTPGALTDYR